MDICGIYKITNLINNKCYIGQSIHILIRWNKHRSAAFNNEDSCYNYPLYRAFRKYGLENFSFEIIEECSQQELDEKELYYIEYYNSLIPNGYNQVLNYAGHKLEPQQIKAIKEELKNSNLNSEEIGKKYNISGRTVRSINSGEVWYDETIKYPIRELYTHNRKFYCKLCGKEIHTNSNLCVECGHKVQQKVERPTRQHLKDLIRNRSFTDIAKIYGVSDNAIRKWCDAEKLPRKKQEIKAYSDKEWELI